jgi:nucleoside-diphosphate-sugar epimerase
VKLLVTGATGFIGQALAARLASDGHDVVGLARDLGRVPAPDGVRFVRGDLSVAGGIERARDDLATADAVVHLAAVRKDWGLDEATLRRVNVESGPALLEEARSAKRFLFMSSVAVYGHSAPGERTSERSPFAPSKRYGVSKVEAEAAIRGAARARGVPATIVRPGIVYGPGDTYGMVANLARLLARGRFLLVGRGTSRINLLFVDDLVSALCSALAEPAAAGEDFILAGPEDVPVGALVEEVAAAAGVGVPRLRVPEAMARAAAATLEATHRGLGISAEPFLTRSKVDLFTRNDLYDASKARGILGWEPSIRAEEGIPRAVAWLRATGWSR